MIKIVDKALLRDLSARARANPRLRQNYNIHDSYDEPCQRLLNAMYPNLMGRFYFLKTVFESPVDTVALASLINDLLNRLDEVHSRSEQAREIISQRYSWQAVVEGYESVFNELVNR